MNIQQLEDSIKEHEKTLQDVKGELESLKKKVSASEIVEVSKKGGDCNWDVYMFDDCEVTSLDSFLTKKEKAMSKEECAFSLARNAKVIKLAKEEFIKCLETNCLFEDHMHFTIYADGEFMGSGSFEILNPKIQLRTRSFELER